MKKRSARLLALVLAMTFLLAILAGCGGGGATPPTGSAEPSGTAESAPPATGGEPTGGVEPAANAHKLSFTIGDPVNSSKAKFYMDLADKTREATNGGLDITVYAGGTLFGHFECLEGVLSGAADMGWFYTPWAPDQFPLTEVISLPLVYNNELALTYTLQELYKEIPELQAELSGFKVVNLYAQPVNYLCTKFPVNSPDDLKGKQIRCTAGGHAECLKAWGASPASLSATEIYEAMQKGVIQGCVYELSGVNTQALHGVIDYFVYIPMFAGPFMVIMNNDSYNNIPDEYKDAFDEIWCAPETSYDFATMFAQEAEDSRVKGVEEFGIEEIYPDEAMLDLFEPAAETYKTDWLAKNTTGSFDAQKYLDRAMELYQEGLEKYPEWTPST